MQMIDCINRINRRKNTISTEKIFERIQHTVMIKAFRRLEMEGNFFNMIKNIYKNPQRCLSGKSFPHKTGTRQGCCFYQCYSTLY